MPTGGNSSRGLHSLGQGNGPRVTGLCAVGVCGSPAGVDVLSGVGLVVAGVRELLGLGGGGSRVVGPSMAGLCGFSVRGATLIVGLGDGHTGPVWATGGGGQKRAAGNVGRGLRVVCWRSCSLAMVCMCGAV